MQHAQRRAPDSGHRLLHTRKLAQGPHREQLGVGGVADEGAHWQPVGRLQQEGEGGVVHQHRARQVPPQPRQVLQAKF